MPLIAIKCLNIAKKAGKIGNQKEKYFAMFASKSRAEMLAIITPFVVIIPVWIPALNMVRAKNANFTTKV